MDAKDSDSHFHPHYFSFANACKGEKIPLEDLAGCRQTRKALASLEYGLVQDRLSLLGLDDECARIEAEVRADLALMAVGLLRYDANRGMVRSGNFLSHVRHWQIEQARALVQLAPDELCQEALWRLDTLPAPLVENVLKHTLRICPGEPAILPMTLCDFWNAGLFVAADVTAARLLECRARTLEWSEKRSAMDPRIILAYLRTLLSHLRGREEAVGVEKLQMRLEQAIDLWKLGHTVGEEFFHLDGSLDAGMRTGLQVIIQHLYEVQRDQEFPWQAEIAGNNKSTIWQYEGNR